MGFDWFPRRNRFLDSTDNVFVFSLAGLQKFFRTGQRFFQGHFCGMAFVFRKAEGDF
jgi:hypothetical protein